MKRVCVECASRAVASRYIHNQIGSCCLWVLSFFREWKKFIEMENVAMLTEPLMKPHGIEFFLHSSRTWYRNHIEVDVNISLLEMYLQKFQVLFYEKTSTYCNNRWGSINLKLKAAISCLYSSSSLNWEKKMRKKNCSCALKWEILERVNFSPCVDEAKCKKIFHL